MENNDKAKIIISIFILAINILFVTKLILKIIQSFLLEQKALIEEKLKAIRVEAI